ncbi:SpoIIE family protein phosphatase [Acidobacteria bacterium AH-259-O06]|nr:SpoIIE family protein phosphatase [Acidobacteria bacterium AH-259-O06]
MKFPCLRVLGPKGVEQVYEIADDEILIGRKSDVDIVLVDPYVSRNHAKILKETEDYRLVDLKSTHGTFVNDQPIEQQVLNHGDRIRLGRLELLFATKQLDITHSTISTTVPDDLEKSMTQLTSVLASAQYSDYSDLEKMNYILDFQYQWGQQFSSEATFQQILRSALSISGAERGFVLAKEEDTFEYSLGLTGEGQVLSQSDFHGSKTVVHQVSSTEEPVFMSEGIEGELAQQKSILEMNVRAVACLPLKGISSELDKPQLLGILYLDSTETMHTLSGLDQKILNKLAGEAGNVLEKLEMIRSFEERKKFEQELAIAYETQKGLLPHSLPQFENFHICAFSEPTRYVGGDFYDFLEHRPNELVGVLADVSGKGVPAALLSSLLQGALDMECRSGAPLEEVLDQVNKFLYARTSANNFVTLFIFSLNSQGKGKFVSAGHNPAYLFRAPTDEIEELASDGLILGAFDFASYQSHTLQLNPGDVLVVYSDGVTDAANPQGEMFGEERLREIVRSSASAGAEVLEKRILDSLEQFTQGMPQTDDITFVLLEAAKG